MEQVAAIGLMVVDDEVTDRSAIVHTLQAAGYQVLEAAGYSDAMGLFDLRGKDVTLLVADISLPDGNGCALAIDLRKQKADLRVLFVSGHVGAEVCKFYGLNVPDRHFLKKPFDAAQLVSRVHDVLTATEGFPALIAANTRTSSG